MGIKGKTIIKLGTAIGSVLAAGAGLLLAKKTGELSEDKYKDMLKLEPLGEGNDDEDEDDVIIMEPEETEEDDKDEDE